MKTFKKIQLLALITLLSFFLIACKKDKNPDVTNETFYYPLLNPSFETVVGTEVDKEWDVYNYDTSLGYKPEGTEGLQCVEYTTQIGGYFSIWQVIPVGNSNYSEKFNTQYELQTALLGISADRFPAKNDVPSFSIDVKLTSETPIEDFSLFRLQIKVENERKVPTIIAESKITSLPNGEWITVETQGTNNDGKIPEDSVLVVFTFNADLPEGASIMFDNAKAYTKTKAGETDDTPIVELPQGYDYFDDMGSYIEIPNNDFEEATNAFKVNGLGASFAGEGYYGSKSLDVPAGAKATYTTALTGSNIQTKTLSSGVWAYINGATGKASLKLRGKIDGTYQELITVSTAATNTWVYLKTPLLAEAYAKKIVTNIEIQLIAEAAECYFDLVQLGDWQRLNGNPHKFAIMCYQPWFQATGGQWGNWAYDSSLYGGRNYNPENDFVRGDKTVRDIASVYYPVIGAYDATDKEVLRYQVKLIKAMNIDCIQVNYYADLSGSAYQLEVLASLFEICEEEGLKMSILYEPKIHLNGWIPHSTRTKSIEAMATDIVKFINNYRDSKALLRYNGKIMVEVFGLNLVSGPEWKTITDSVKSQAGEDVILMGDGIGSNDYTNITSMFQWNLYRNELATADSAACINFNKEINNKVLDWVAANGYSKWGVGIVYPGFDDTPVRSWGNQANSPIRKINRTGVDFYNDSWAAMETVWDRFDWIVFATFNDWTEGTIIEPTLELGHQLAYKTAVQLAEYKGLTAPTLESLEQITNDYLNTRTTQYR